MKDIAMTQMPKKMVENSGDISLYRAVQQAVSDLPKVLEYAEAGALEVIRVNEKRFRQVLDPVEELIKQGANIYQRDMQEKSALDVVEMAINAQQKVLTDWEESKGYVPYKYSESNKCKQLKNVYERFKKEIIHQQLIQNAIQNAFVYMDREEFYMGNPIALLLNQRVRS